LDGPYLRLTDNGSRSRPTTATAGPGYFVVSPVTYFLLASEVGQMVQRSGRPSRVKGITGLWILLPLVGPIVWFVKVQGQLNDYWRANGATG
jgi:hypothetical protein